MLNTKSMINPVLQVESLSKQYGNSRGITDVSLTVERGDVFGFIGPNGAGKSTTIRALLGLIFPDSGTVTIFGEDGLKKGSELRKRIGFVPSELNYYEGLNVFDLLHYSASFYQKANREKINQYANRLDLDLRRRIADLSLGNRKKVTIIQALIHQPELLILDEPTSGLDPLIQSRFYQILKEEKERGCTIFFSSHTLSEVERLCNKVAIIRDGSIIKVSRIDELKKIYLKRFRLIFEGNKVADLSGTENVRDLKITGNIAEGLFSGDINQLLRDLLHLSSKGFLLKDIVLEDPNLEEIFMHYYSEETLKKDNRGGV